MEKLRKEEELDIIVQARQDPNPPPDDAAATPVPSRLDLYNMVKALDKNYKLLNETLDNLQIQIKRQDNKEDNLK